MGGHDDRHYFKAKWTPELWEEIEVQREKSTSSLHMEALQLLVMARVMGEKWTRFSLMSTYASEMIKNQSCSFFI